MGSDADGAEIYAGRCHHEGDIIPAKVIPSKNACYISYGGEEVFKDQFEVRLFLIFCQLVVPSYDARNIEGVPLSLGLLNDISLTLVSTLYLRRLHYSM